MKKKLSVLLTVLLAVGLLVGCDSEKNKPIHEVEVEKYVSVGEYKGIEVAVPGVAINEAEKAALVQQVYYSQYEVGDDGIKDRAVKDGDLVNIDYEGKKDGVAFAGGTAQNQQLGIGSNSFIDGFEDGLIGVMPGETVDLNLTFPEVYHSAELAGQAVVFTVTVNYIYPPYSDDVVASWGQEAFSTVAELEQYVQMYLEMMYQSDYENQLRNAVAEKFLEQCTYEKVPNWLIKKYRESLLSDMNSMATTNNMDAETYCLQANGMPLEDFLETYSEETARQMLAFQAVANAEGLNKTEEELEATLSELASLSGLATVEEFIGDLSREEYREYFMFEDVINYLMENAVVSAE